jgi:hypothetical protein
MSTEESNEQEAPERAAAATDEDDTQGHQHAAQSADPDFGSRALGKTLPKADENDDVEGHALHS